MPVDAYNLARRCSRQKVTTNGGIMSDKSGTNGVSRRNFLATSGSALAAAVAVPTAAAALSGAAPPSEQPLSKAIARKIPIGVFDPAFPDWSTDQMLEKFSAWGVEAVEIGTGGYPGSKHCPVDEMLADDSKLNAWRKKFDDRNIQIATLSCHGNPVFPDAKIAAGYQETFRKTVLLAEKLGVKVIVGFSGCPGGSPTDSTPAWITYRWPPEHATALDWQWKEKVVPYWKERRKVRAGARHPPDRARDASELCGL